MCCQSPLWDSRAFFLYANSMCMISDWVGVVERPLHCPQSGSSASCAIYTVRNAHKQQMYQVSHLVWPLVPFLYVSCWWIWNEVGFGVIVLLSQRHWFLFKAGKTVIFLYCFLEKRTCGGRFSSFIEKFLGFLYAVCSLSLALLPTKKRRWGGRPTFRCVRYYCRFALGFFLCFFFFEKPFAHQIRHCCCKKND